MKKITLTIAMIISVVTTAVFLQGCATSQAIADKSGAQLWGENCVRCHINPSPVDFNDEQWTTLSLHMRIRANLTQDETKKIFDFLKMSN
ncbi:MAG TPA: cytochrome c [Bacteroidia bacterium]|nr:cytochrome c [Bacteroidia bacterium]